MMLEAYDGKHGLFWHNYRSKTDRYVKVGYHEGLVDAETWLAVQDKFGRKFIPKKKSVGIRSWMTGLLRCGACDHAVKVGYSYNPKSGNSWTYFECTGYNSVRGCDGNGIKLKVADVEQAVLTAMKEHLREYEIARKCENKPSIEEDKIKAEILRIDTETTKLMDKLADADTVLFEYIQNRIGTLHDTKMELEKKLMSVGRRIKKVNTKPLMDPLEKWDTLSKEEKNQIARLIIDKVYISVEKGVEIHFSF